LPGSCCLVCPGRGVIRPGVRPRAAYTVPDSDVVSVKALQ
jgi:hypothetical protein